MPSNFSRRADRKKQTHLIFDAVEPTSSSTMSPARILYDAPFIKNRDPSLKSQKPVDDGESYEETDDLFPPGKNYAVIIQSSPKRQKRNGTLPFEPVSRPLASTHHSSNALKTGGLEDSDLEILPTSTRRRRVLEGKPQPGIDLPLPKDYTDLSQLGAGFPSSSFMPKSSVKRRTRRQMFGDDGDSSQGSPPEEEEPSMSSTRRKTSKVVLISDSGDESPLQSPERVSVNYEQVILSHKDNSGLATTGKEKNSTARSFIKGGNSYYAPVTRKDSTFKSKTKSGAELTPSKSSAKGKKDELIRFSEDSDSNDFGSDGDNLPTPRGTQGSSSKNKKDSMTLEDESDDPVVSTQRSKITPQNNRINIESDDDDDDPIGPAQSSERRRRNATSKMTYGIINLDDDEDELPDIANIKVTPSSKRRLRVSKIPAQVSENDDDEDEDEPVLSSPTKRRRRTEPREDDSDEDLFVASPAKRLRTGRRHGSDSEDGNRLKRKGKGKVINKVATPRLTRQQQQRDRTSHRTAKQKQLELLKRQRAGEKISEVTSSESDGEEEVRRGVYDSDADMEALSEFDDEEDDEEEDGIEAVRQSIRGTNRNTYDDDFIVDDDDAPLGVPDIMHEIPLQFTHRAHKQFKEHFKDVVEWLVQKKINPMFPKDDPVYVQAFKKLDDEVHGYASSKFSSSAWTEPFMRALWARPIIYEQQLGPLADISEQKCGACNRSGHIPTFEIQFAGPAYYKHDLEEVDNDHTEESDEGNEDDDSDGSSVNSKGQPIPKESRTWLVGRFCKANAETAHSLIHWKYALNEWVLDTLRSEGHLEPEKLAERENWRTKQKSDYANNIVDKWESGKQILGLYRDFKANLESARENKQGRWKT